MTLTFWNSTKYAKWIDKNDYILAEFVQWTLDMVIIALDVEKKNIYKYKYSFSDIRIIFRILICALIVWAIQGSQVTTFNKKSEKWCILKSAWMIFNKRKNVLTIHLQQTSSL